MDNQEDWHEWFVSIGGQKGLKKILDKIDADVKKALEKYNDCNCK